MNAVRDLIPTYQKKKTYHRVQDTPASAGPDLHKIDPNEEGMIQTRNLKAFLLIYVIHILEQIT